MKVIGQIAVCAALIAMVSASFNSLEPGLRSSIACEDETLLLKCPIGQQIVIESGVYGRTSNVICTVDMPDGQRVFDCQAATAQRVLENACNNRRACSVTSSNEIFGDPCVGTYKYAMATYSCN